MAATFNMPLPALKRVLMASSTFDETLGPAEPLSLLAHTLRAGQHSPELYVLLLPKHRRHLDHDATDWRRGIHALLITIQADAGSIEFGQGVRHVQDASTKPVDRPYHQDIKPTPYRVLQYLVEAGAPFAPLGAADALVFVRLDNRPTTMLSGLGEDEPLVLCGLIVAADPQVNPARMPSGCSVVVEDGSRRLIAPCSLAGLQREITLDSAQGQH